MNIVKFESENVMVLEAIEIKPDGKPVVLTGDNEQGKSSILNSIVMAMQGKMPDRPIRDGASKARITLDLGDYIVERRITQKGTYLDVYAKDGSKIPSPQSLLNRLCGDLTIDPMEFSRMKPRDQREMLLKVAGIDLTAWEDKYKAAYDKRTESNRESKRTETVWQNAEVVDEDTPDEEVSAEAILKEIEAIQTQRDQRQEASRVREDLGYEVVRIQKQRNEQQALIEDLKQQLQAAEELLVTLDEQLSEQQALIDTHEIPEAPTIEELQAAKEKLANLEQTNRKVRAKKAQQAAKETFLAARRNAEAADEEVKQVEAEKDDILKKANFGVPGLSIDDEGVTFESIPFGQLSTARQIQVSTLMAMHQNPRLKIIMIREGALIGSKIWQAIVDLAKEHGYQLWVEKMQEKAGDVGLHIRAGRIVAVDGQPVAEEAALNKGQA